MKEPRPQVGEIWTFRFASHDAGDTYRIENIFESNGQQYTVIKSLTNLNFTHPRYEYKHFFDTREDGERFWTRGIDDKASSGDPEPKIEELNERDVIEI